MVVVAITNGSLSERTSLIGSSIHTFLMVAFIYPVIVSWTWGQGWLDYLGFLDYSGSGIVHLCGAAAGAAGLCFCGTRYNKWNTYEDILADMNIHNHEPESDKHFIGLDTNTVATFMTSTG
jgi:ammonium transporter, Amt family